MSLHCSEVISYQFIGINFIYGFITQLSPSICKIHCTCMSVQKLSLMTDWPGMDGHPFEAVAILTEIM